MSTRLISAHSALLTLALAAGLSAIGYALFYLSTPYERLARWYIALNDCFYRREHWQQAFFTEQTKTDGNLLCAMGLAVGAALAAYACFRLLKDGRGTPAPAPMLAARPVDRWCRGGLLLAGLLFWAFSHYNTSPAYDEIFSAVNGAGIHPFQTLSYYMLPNNHLAFNVLNNIIFSGFEDRVLSGRFISLAAFVAVLQVMYALMRQKMPAPAALGVVMVLALSLPTLGFASQARGYGLHLLAGWLSLLGLYRCFAQGGRAAAWASAAGIFLGYATLPSFLYFHLALVVFAAVLQGYRGKWALAFWEHQAVALSLVFLFHLPAFSFSGIEAFAGNKYVRADSPSAAAFLPQFAGLLHFFMNYGFSSVWGENKLIVALLYLLPFSLLFSKNQEQRSIALFYGLMWGAAILIVIAMRKVPFSRNLIIQYSIGLSVILYASYCWLSVLARRIGRGALLAPLFGALLACLGLAFALRFPKIAGEQLYFNRANYLYEVNSRDIANLPRDEPIAFSDESFYWFYLCQQAGYLVNRCPHGDEQYFVKRIPEPLPERLREDYVPHLRLEADGYEIFKKR